MRNTVKCVHSRYNCSTQFLARSLGFRFVGLQTGPSFFFLCMAASHCCSSSNETLCWGDDKLYYILYVSVRHGFSVQLSLFCTELYFTCVAASTSSSSSNVTFSFVGWRRCQRRWCVVERKTHRPSSTRWSSQGELDTKALVHLYSMCTCTYHVRTCTYVHGIACVPVRTPVRESNPWVHSVEKWHFTCMTSLNKLIVVAAVISHFLL